MPRASMLRPIQSSLRNISCEQAEMNTPIALCSGKMPYSGLSMHLHNIRMTTPVSHSNDIFKRHPLYRSEKEIKDRDLPGQIAVNQELFLTNQASWIERLPMTENRFCSKELERIKFGKYRSNYQMFYIQSGSLNEWTPKHSGTSQRCFLSCKKWE